MTVAARRPLVAGNWKMHLTEARAAALTQELVERLPELDAVDVAVAPPFPFLRAALDSAAGSRLLVGAQNAHGEASGAFTGEVSVPMLADMGIRFVIVGHSERRTLFGETDEAVASKVAAVLRGGLDPIVCVGETAAERDAGLTLPTIERQVRSGLAAVDRAEGGRLVVAYEPVWAIGTGRVPSGSQIAEVHAAVRGLLGALFGAPSASAIRILYGGSVSDKNAAEILPIEDVDGALIGGASLDAAKFGSIAAAALPDGRSAC